MNSNSSTRTEHFVIDDNGFYLFECLFKSRLNVSDFIFDKRIESRIHLEFELKQLFINKPDSDFCFHIYLHLFNSKSAGNIFKSKLFYGIDVYHYIISQQKADLLKKHSFVFYGFHSHKQLLAINPSIYPDLEVNNYRQLPVALDVFKTAPENQKMYEPDAVNFWRGKLMSELKIAGDKETEVLLMDDMFCSLKYALGKVIPHKIVGLQLSRSEFKDLEKVKAGLLKLIEENNNIKYIISDLFLSDNHVKFVSNPVNSEKISGFIVYKEVIKSIDRLKDLPIIFLSSSSRIWNYRTIKDDPNFIGWVVKPKFVYSENRMDEIKYAYEDLCTHIQTALTWKKL